MKKIFTLFLIIACITNLSAQDARILEHNVQSCKQHVHLKMQQAAYNPLDVVYTQAFWYINPAEYYISGHVNHWFKPSGNALSVVDFDLQSSLQVDSVLRGNVKIDFVRTDTSILIEYPNPLSGLDSVKIYYKGAPFNSGFGSFERNYHSGTPIVWTLSEPYGCRDWWPSRQNLVDKTDSFDIFISSPEQYTAASNGILVNNKIRDGVRTAHWKHRHPIAAYLVALAVTNYSVYNEYIRYGDNDSILMQNYVYPESLTSAKAGTARLIPVMQLYNNLFMLYPFANEKYGHAQFGWGGGMEHQTMTFVGSFSLSLLAHELAHQWFGDYITCGSWQDIWLNEGFATYLEGIAAEAGYFSYSFTDWKRDRINSICSQSAGSVFVYDTTSVDRIFSSRLSYNKGAMVLHMLRTQIGDTAFFGAIRNYLHNEDHADGFALTAHLREHFEQKADTTLTTFFDDWVFGEGFPIYNIQWSTSGTQLKITLSQTQSHSSVGFFEMKLPFRIQAPGVDTVVWLHNTYSGEQFTLNLKAEATALTYNPYSDIVSRASISRVTGIQEAEEGVNAIVSNGELQIVSHTPLQISDWQIINMDGKRMAKGKVMQNVGNIHRISVSDFHTGYYILHVRINDSLVSRKFFVE